MALRSAPAGAARLMGALPPAALAAMQAARFRRTLRLAAARSAFYREQFRLRGIKVEQHRASCAARGLLHHRATICDRTALTRS